MHPDDAPRSPPDDDPVTEATLRARDAQQAQSAETETALRSAGQREVSQTWEKTQRQLSLSTLWVGLVVASVLALGGKWLGIPEVQLAAVVFLFGICNLIVSNYFTRTNSHRVGGPGGDDAGSRR